MKMLRGVSVLALALVLHGGTVMACEAETPGHWRLDLGEGAAVQEEPGGRGARLALPRASCDDAARAKPLAAARSLKGAATARLGVPRIEFEGGTAQDRQATVVPGTAGQSDFLRFTLSTPNVKTARGVPAKGRVQLDLYGNSGAQQVQESVRMRLGPGFETLLAYPEAIDWMTISELWNNAPWTDSRYPFRISVNLVKGTPGEGSGWHLAVHAQTMNPSTKKWDRTVWEQQNNRFTLVPGRWLQLRIEFVEGDATSGRFSLMAQEDGQPAVQVFNVTNWTHHPDDPAPDGLSHWNPIKLYTGSRPINFLSARGEKLDIDWSGLAVVACGSEMQMAGGSGAKAGQCK